MLAELPALEAPSHTVIMIIPNPQKMSSFFASHQISIDSHGLDEIIRHCHLTLF